MTIYILDQDPKLCAEMLDNVSLNKMVKMIAQVLCNVHCVLYPENNPLLKPVKDCDWLRWARKCKANYLWLIELELKLIDEKDYRAKGNFRFKSQYKSYNGIFFARDNIPDLPRAGKHENGSQTRYILNGDCTPLLLVMPKKYICWMDQISDEGYGYSPNPNIIESYRNWYQAKLKQRHRAVCASKNGWQDCHNGKMLTGYHTSPAEEVCPHFGKWTNRSRPGWLQL